MTKLTVTARYESRAIQTNIELWKLYCPFKFLKTTIAIRDNLHQVYPSVPCFEFAVLFITSFNVLSGYFNVLALNLVAVRTVWILVNSLTQDLFKDRKLCKFINLYMYSLY